MQQKSLHFHIQQNDYFGTLATVLDLIRQDLDPQEYRRHAETLAGLRDNLIYLQHTHRIQVIPVNSLPDEHRNAEPSSLIQPTGATKPNPIS